MFLLVIQARARDDIDEIADHIYEDQPEAAIRFVRAAQATALQLAEYPFSGAAFREYIPTHPKLRYYPVVDFHNYLLLYEFDGTTLVIIRVMHGARDIPKLLNQMHE